MRCTLCSRRAVVARPRLCKDHFSSWFEERVDETITTYSLFSKRDRVAVACSGGKDSTALLFVLKRLGYDVTALAIDEGIAGYRDRTLADLKRFCEKNKVPLKIVSFQKEYGAELDAMLTRKELHPCTVCGTFRRQLLNKAARGFDVLATGHNADDESQAVLMNLCRANTALFTRIGPLTASGTNNGVASEQDRGLSVGGVAKRGFLSGEGRFVLRAEAHRNGFVRKAKPLYFLTEKACLTYALLHHLATAWNECPYAPRAYRNDVRAALLVYERAHPGARERVLRHFLTVKERLPSGTTRTVSCASCGEPSTSGRCKACRLRTAI